MAAIRFGLIGMGRHGMRYAQHLMLSAVFAENSRWSPRSFSLQLVHQWTMCGQQNIPSLTLECPCIFTMVPQERDPQTEVLLSLPLHRRTEQGVPREQGLLYSIGKIQDNFCAPQGDRSAPLTAYFRRQN